MNKRYIHHVLVKVRSVSQRLFVILFVLSAFITVMALRENNLKMVRLRDEVFAADREGRDVSKPLDDLRKHVYAHMNTDLTSGDNPIRPPIQLTHTYDRLVKTERDKVAAANKKVNDTAVAICERRFPAGQLRSGRVRCVTDYMTKHSVKEKQIPKELYQFDFVSPVWSPDVAGFGLIVAGVFLLLSALRFVLERWLKHQLDV